MPGKEIKGRSKIASYRHGGKAKRKPKAKGGRIGLRDRVFAKGGKVNTSKENRLEELGRVDSEKAFSKKGKRNLRGEKRRIVRELKK